MSTKYKFYNPSGDYFVSLVVTDRIDVFTRKIHKDIVVQNLNYCPASIYIKY